LADLLTYSMTICCILQKQRKFGILSVRYAKLRKGRNGIEG